MSIKVKSILLITQGFSNLAENNKTDSLHIIQSLGHFEHFSTYESTIKFDTNGF